MKKHLSTIALVLVFVVGLSLLLYPTISDYWNSMHQSYAIATYTETVAQMDNISYDNVWQEARDYNQTLAEKPNRWFLTDEEKEIYASLLNVAGNGIMGYIEIPSLNVRLPMYHGTDEAVLQIAIGHIEGTSLPVGGLGSHSVLSGHRGLPSAKLFSNLDQMAEGDAFLLHVLDETLTYEVDQILVVEPEDVEALELDPAMDLCTLVTCTPYGVNSHRLLVRGHRVDTVTVEEKAPVRISNEAIQIDEWLVAPFAAVPVLLVLGLISLIKPKKKK